MTVRSSTERREQYVVSILPANSKIKGFKIHKFSDHVKFLKAEQEEKDTNASIMLEHNLREHQNKTGKHHASLPCTSRHLHHVPHTHTYAAKTHKLPINHPMRLSKVRVSNSPRHRMCLDRHERTAQEIKFAAYSIPYNHVSWYIPSVPKIVNRKTIALLSLLLHIPIHS